jgi:transposase
MQRGQQKRIPAFTVANRSYHLIGAYNWRTDQVFSQAVERKNSQTFIQFLEYLLVECFPTEKIVLVMDNASYHRSKTVRAALSLFEPRVRVVWLPKYCPDLNPIERFWRHLKDLACANKLDLSLENLADRVDTIMDYQNSSDHVLKMSFLKNYV